jgi:hypothetical protein
MAIEYVSMPTCAHSAADCSATPRARRAPVPRRHGSLVRRPRRPSSAERGVIAIAGDTYAQQLCDLGATVAGYVIG